MAELNRCSFSSLYLIAVRAGGMTRRVPGWLDVGSHLTEEVDKDLIDKYSDTAVVVPDGCH